MATPLAASIFFCAIVAPLALGWWFSRRRRPRWAVRAAFWLYPFFCVAAIGLAAGADWRTYAAWGLVLGFIEISIVLQWQRQTLSAGASNEKDRPGRFRTGPWIG